MLTSLTFTDPQGQSYTDAVVAVQQATYDHSWRGNEHEKFTNPFDKAGSTGNVTSSDDASENITLRISFVYWPTQAAYDANNLPYPLANTTPAANSEYEFRIFADELSKPKYTSLTLEQKCEQYFTDEVLPTLQPS
ncbi:hypothetical protein IT774_07655 [Salinimonas marina]|uniref:Uncharacterized protein n=1 Tax=Salinimonas marina TaxID=2785918 RepID=A0A7S9E0V0_9ALTE|nr:hypothetical protein [Salinimonas marina]QPG06970.1 hypothetical protein IT774_07655 [Salinimonas marina]